MFAVWDFVKRHRKKIIFGGVVLGGALGALTYNKNEEQQPFSGDEYIQTENRRRYIYDSNHSTCDDSIRDLAKNLSLLVERRFEVDNYIAKIQSDEAISNGEKVVIWEKIRNNSFARIVALAYSFAILTISLKIQFSILTAVICEQIEQPKKEEFSWLGKLAFFNDKSEEREKIDTAGSKQTFLKCIQFFNSSGIYKLFDLVENVIENLCGDMKLISLTNRSAIRHLFDRVDEEMSVKLNGELWKLIAPIPDDMDSTDEITKLLRKLVHYLNTPESAETMQHLLDFYYSAACEKISEESEEVARHIPSVSNCFETVGSTSYDGPLKTSLCSSKLHRFSQMVFKNYKDY